MLEFPVHADFLADVREQLASRLRSSGHVLPASFTVDDVAVRYFDFKWRQVPTAPRRVAQSRELVQHNTTPEHEAGLRAIIDDATIGRSLAPYFSRRWMDLEFNDILFNDWHVRHMHLGGRSIGADGFAPRTRPVLFVYITRGTIYMIDVIDHGREHHTTFAKKRIVQILHDNWPDLIAHGRMPGVSNLSPNDDESRARLSRRTRGTHFALGVEVDDGTVYGLIGGSYMSDGRCMMARRVSDAFLNDAVHLQKWAHSSALNIRNDIMRSMNMAVDELRLRLELKHIVRGVEISIRETEFNYTVLTGRRIHFPPDHFK